jgi:hypothetical protein
MLMYTTLIKVSAHTIARAILGHVSHPTLLLDILCNVPARFLTEETAVAILYFVDHKMQYDFRRQI